MTGKVDFTRAIEKVALSYNNKIARLVGDMFAQAYTSINADLKHEGAMDEKTLLELIAKVGNDAVIYGSKVALAKIPGITGFDVDSRDIRAKGYVGMFRGITCVELVNHYDPETKKFAIPNDTLYIVPGGKKVLCGGFEGEARIIEDLSGTRKDRQIEYFYMRRFHLGLAVASRYGAYKVNA